MIEEEHFGYIGNKEISKYILKNKQLSQGPHNSKTNNPSN